MTTQVIVVLILTFLINLITTLSYSVRIVGIRTGRIAISFALFNILVLVSRTANGFQAPLLAKTVEMDIKHGVFDNIVTFRLIIFSCSLATLAGAFLIPTFQRVLAKAVINFSVHKSMSKLVLHGFSKGGILYFKDNLTLPARENVSLIKLNEEFPWRMFFLNIVAIAILTIGVLSAVYASYLNPDYRSTASNLSAFINGFATILMFAFIDPNLSAMTDDVTLGKCSESTFRKQIVYMTIARFLGTILAQLIFLPSAKFLAWAASYL
ncbi:lipid II flippase Amj family protein [Solitalea lacus]|uniref:lipid II flippase Amj family protein n=1 Tax=Solitalea lacus TaxID=2911172 RepID=UPI001EDA5C5C|nr:lipid II flippase Amj family protein [Solitalea lacus]UKJ06218.1 lipid II flippase Amj family protein [Solitalea lacus]